jgi:hypothetical protein
MAAPGNDEAHITGGCRWHGTGPGGACRLSGSPADQHDGVITVHLVTCLLPWLAAAEADPAYAPARELCRLSNRDLTESSGLAASRRTPGAYWTINDSGNPARLYAFDQAGTSLGAINVTGVRNHDWEDLASATIGGRDLLLIGDCGDNLSRRTDCSVVVCLEPQLQPAPPATVGTLLVAGFTWEDGPRNCEALAVDPADGIIYLISKMPAEKPCALYRLRTPLCGDPPAATYTATKVLDLTLPVVSAMDIAPDGRRLLVGTYGDAREYHRQPDQDWTQALSAKAAVVKLPRAKQREAACYDRDGTSLLFTSETGDENSPCPVVIVPPAGAP